MIQQSTTYTTDIFHEGASRWLWLHKEEREFHGKSDVRSYTIPIMPSCVGDSI